MNRFNETVYNLWPSGLIQSRKKSSPYFTDENAKQRDVDVIKLAEKIARRHHKILEKTLTFTLDVKSRNFSHKDVLEYFGFQDKGVSVIWHDRNGNEILFVNTGRNPSIGKNKIAIQNGAFSESDIESLKQRLLKEISRKDVEKNYRKIAPKEKNPLWQKEIRVAGKGKFFTVGDFEKDFKNRIKAQEAYASMRTFLSMVKAMSGSQKKSLLKTLNTIGIKSDEDFKDFLSRWWTEALNEEHTKYKKSQIIIDPS